MFSTNGIMLNHESLRHEVTFLTRKIICSIGWILAGNEKHVCLGNLEANRDWGYAPEYVETTWLMLQQDEPDDYVIGIRETHSVKEFLIEAFGYASLDWQKYVKIDPCHFRPLDMEMMIADSSQAGVKPGWEPRVTFNKLVRILVDADISAVGLESNGKEKQSSLSMG